MAATAQLVRSPTCQACLTQYAVDHSSDAALWMDQECNFIYVNPAAGALLGYTPDELLQMNLLDIAPEAGGPACGLPAKPGPLETTFHTRDGSRVPVEMLVSHVRLDGRDFQCAFARDLSNRRHLEEQLREAHKMEAVGRLVDSVAHDFNNLLTAIMIYAGLLLNEFDADEAVRKSVEQVSAAAERGRALIAQLLGFGRRQVVEPRLLCLNRLLGSLCDMLQRLLGEDIALLMECASDLGAVLADPAQMEQIVVNLAVNARDAMPEGGQLRIATCNFEASERFARLYPGMAPGVYVQLTVADNGCGMDAETHAHAFEPFFTTKEDGRGTGLGLSTVYSIVRQSGGQIALESASGRGTTVRIFLPRAPGEATNVLPASAEVDETAGSGTVLLVEDEDLVRQSLCAILTCKGYQVLQARHPREALFLGQNYGGPIDLVLTDLVMPQMSGSELVERLQCARPGLRVLFISGYRDDARVRRLVDAGQPFFAKPFSASDIAQKVREVLEPSPRKLVPKQP